MIKKTTMSREKEKIPFRGFYTAIARACNCSVFYAKAVLSGNYGVYKGIPYQERNTPLARKIRAKAAEFKALVEAEPPAK